MFFHMLLCTYFTYFKWFSLFFILSGVCLCFLWYAVFALSLSFFCDAWWLCESTPNFAVPLQYNVKKGYSILLSSRYRRSELYKDRNANLAAWSTRAFPLEPGSLDLVWASQLTTAIDEGSHEFVDDRLSSVEQPSYLGGTWGWQGGAVIYWNMITISIPCARHSIFSISRTISVENSELERCVCKVQMRFRRT